MRYSPRSPRRQRKALFTAPPPERRRRMTVLLSRELRARFRLRSVPVRKGDTVRVLSGSFVGREERVAKVDRRGYAVTLDNVTLKAADEKLKPLALRPAHLVITRLNLSDPWRRKSLRVRDEAVTPEERGEEAPPTEEGTADAVTASEANAPTRGRSDEEPEEGDAATESPAAPGPDAEPGASETEAPAAKPKRTKAKRSARSDESDREDSA